MLKSYQFFVPSWQDQGEWELSKMPSSQNHQRKLSRRFPTMRLPFSKNNKRLLISMCNMLLNTLKISDLRKIPQAVIKIFAFTERFLENGHRKSFDNSFPFLKNLAKPRAFRLLLPFIVLKVVAFNCQSSCRIR